jgi:L-seryl-tRNA(Ser) seleniumtransferase
VKAVSKTDLYRKLPSVDELVHRPELAQLVLEEGMIAVTDAGRTVIACMRHEIDSGGITEESMGLALSGLPVAVERQLRSALRYSLNTVINATGVILHTNLGRAPLSRSALDHIQESAIGYSNLEIDLESGERGQRDIHVDRLFRKLLNQDAHVGASFRPTQDEQISSQWAGAPVAPLPISTIVVNNNAAAVLLALNTLAEGGGAIVSRGELVEIGGSFRIPEVMAKSNAILREVGTTNRTRIPDYENAINERTRLLLRVHRSNFEITGFTEQPSLEDLAELAHRHNLPLVEDLGSGALIDLSLVDISSESNVLSSLRAGVDVVTYSGDKLLGGPQAGLISGRADLIARMRSNSLFRALRVDKLTYAALEATLLAYVKQQHDSIPVLRMMRLSKEEIGARAAVITKEIPPGKMGIELINGVSVIGGGAAPSAALPTCLLALSHQDFSADSLCARLRSSYPPIIARVEEGRVLLDLRTVFLEQDFALQKVLAHLSQ